MEETFGMDTSASFFLQTEQVVMLFPDLEIVAFWVLEVGVCPKAQGSFSVLRDSAW